jgi:gliding motility-associated-like protein
MRILSAPSKPLFMKNWLITLLCFCFIAIGFGQLNAQIGRIKIRPDVDSVYVCPDSSITLEVTGGFNYSWSPANILSRSNGNLVVAKPTQNTRIFVEGFVNGQLRKDTITLVVVRPTLQLIALTSTSVCRGTPVRLRAVTNTGGQGVTWDPVNGLDKPNSANVIALPGNTTTYRAVLNVTGCKVDATIQVSIAPQKIDITNGDTVKVCKGKTKVKLGATTNTGLATGVSWTAKDKSISRQNVLSVDVEPKITTTYYATLVATPCTIIDSVVVKVDSLPTLTITIDPKKEVYCQGEIITLKSDTYETAVYPDIKHAWRPRLRLDGSLPGYDFQTPDSLWNMVLGTIDSVVLIRDTRNNGCIDSAAILVPVIKPKNIVITPNPAEVCPGASIQLTATFAGNFDKITWAPTNGLSCTDCKTPTVTTSQNATYSITVEEKKCPSNASATVTVLPVPSILFPTLRTVCQGGTIQLNGANQQGVTYRWTQGGNQVSTDPLFRVNPTSTTTYRLEATSTKNCKNTGDITVSVIPTVNSIDITGLTICSNDNSRPVYSVKLNNPPGTVPALVENYSWQVLGSTLSTTASLNLNLIRNTSLVSVTYTYGVQGGSQCGRLTDTATIKVIQMPTENGIFFAPDSVSSRGAQEGDALTAGIRLVQPPNPVPLTYSWTVNGGSPTTSPTVNALATPGQMTFKVVVTGPNGCAITKEISISVVPAKVTIPNAFSPNSDGANDFFRPITTNKNVKLIEMKIYSRWGKLVYSGNDLKGWDGNINGKPAPVEVYVYNIVIEFPGGRRETRSGDVALLR